MKATAPSAVVVAPTNNKEYHDEDPEAGEARVSPPEKECGRKNRKRSATVADGIDVLFDDAIGRKVVRSAVEPAPAPRLWSTRHEGKKRNRRRLGPAT